MTPFGFNSVANIFGAQPQQPSMFGGLGNFSNALTGLGLGIAQSDPNMPWARRATQGLAGFSAGRQLDKKAKKEREREEALKGALANAKDLGIPPTLAPYFQAYPEQFGSVLANSLKSKEPDLPTSYQEYMLGKNDPDYAKTLQSQDGLPTSVEEYQFAVQQGYQGSLQDWITGQKKAGATNIDLGDSSFAKEFGKQNATNFFERRQAATDAAASLQAAEQATQLLDSGVITGFGADWAVGAGKALQQMGFNVAADPIANTEAFAATRAQEVGRIIKLFGAGTGLSDADREFATKAAAGQITMNEASIRRILDINQRAARNVITLFNKDAGTIDPSLSPYPLSVEMPAAAPPKVPSGTTSGGVRWQVEPQ